MLEKATCLSKSEHGSPYLSWFSMKHSWVLTPSRPWACLNGMGWDTDQQHEALSKAAHIRVESATSSTVALGWEVTGRPVTF